MKYRVDEARLLRLFGALQRGETGEAVEFLQVWLPSKPLRLLLRYARSFVGVMASQKLILPDRMPDGRPQCTLRTSIVAFLDRRSILLH
jgi:hypothetical protein